LIKAAEADTFRQTLCSTRPARNFNPMMATAGGSFVIAEGRKNVVLPGEIDPDNGVHTPGNFVNRVVADREREEDRAEGR